ncbi:hypothetical protein PENANT_c095G04240 [Penicillium antarcticum]|uniref:Uncharacterized protein n=1 Tax=Penicillium antarcticum TaxID=416450 RepID=A0A1V6PLZ1_9EURO|nr:hypothetical protein PENANT_c095G04240 [Penicillium antarcticum]
MHPEWVDWWLETDYGKTSKIRWDAAHQSEHWKQFDQVADATTGQPKGQMKEQERTGDIQIYTRLPNSVLPSIKERREQFDVQIEMDLTEYIDHLTAVENNIPARRLALSNRKKDAKGAIPPDRGN